MERLYRLPDGSVTKDADLYGNTWASLARAVERHFPSYEWTGIDPGILMSHRDRYKPGGEATSFTLPVTAAIELTGWKGQ